MGIHRLRAVEIITDCRKKSDKERNRGTLATVDRKHSQMLIKHHYFTLVTHYSRIRNIYAKKRQGMRDDLVVPSRLLR